MALAHPADQLMAHSRNERPEVRRKFLDRIGAATAGDEVNLAVVIEEDRQVMPAGELVALPGTLD